MYCIVQGLILDSTVKLYLGTTFSKGSWYVLYQGLILGSPEESIT